MKIAKDGIFPITKDQHGHPLPISPASGLDIPGTIQGEGKLCGVPSLFIRLAGCNLHCCWTLPNNVQVPCDTSYAAYELQNVQTKSVNDICSLVLQNTDSIRHLVITGGEPLLQAQELEQLCEKLKKERKYHITLETNGTLFDEKVARYIDLFSLSPKLSASHSSCSGKPLFSVTTIQNFIRFASSCGKDFQLKFVYSCKKDAEEIRQLLSRLQGWKPEDILLMPLGATPELIRINTREVLTHCIRNGWRYCDRLHISLFGNKIGV